MTTIDVRVIRITCAVSAAPRWIVEATDGARDWSDTFWDREDADQVAADIEQGLFDPWDD